LWHFAVLRAGAHRQKKIIKRKKKEEKEKEKKSPHRGIGLKLGKPNGRYGRLACR
jgi:hypothetical protein